MLTNLSTWLPLLLVIAATPRATRIVTRDKLPLIAIPRDAFVRRWGAYEDEPNDDAETRRERRKIAIGGKATNVVMSSLAYLWECDWCVSIWLGGLLTFLTWMWPETMIYVLVPLVASYAAGWNADAETKGK